MFFQSHIDISSRQFISTGGSLLCSSLNRILHKQFLMPFSSCFKRYYPEQLPKSPSFCFRDREQLVREIFFFEILFNFSLMGIKVKLQKRLREDFLPLLS